MLDTYMLDTYMFVIVVSINLQEKHEDEHRREASRHKLADSSRTNDSTVVFVRSRLVVHFVFFCVKFLKLHLSKVCTIDWCGKFRFYIGVSFPIAKYTCTKMRHSNNIK